MTVITAHPVRRPFQVPAVVPGRAQIRPRRARREVAELPVGPLRLTRRGRLVIAALLLAIGVAVTSFTGPVSQAGTRLEPVPVSYVTVAPGQTLWGIATEVAPDADPRDTVQRILDLNALESSGVQAGQRIAVPVGG